MAQPTSAKNGKVVWEGTELSHATQWTFREPNDTQEYASSGTAGYKNRIAGHNDATGSFNLYFDSGADWRGVLKRGDIGTLQLFRDGTKFYEIEAIILDTEESADIEGGAAIKVAFNFGLATGTVTIPV